MNKSRLESFRPLKVSNVKIRFHSAWITFGYSIKTYREYIYFSNQVPTSMYVNRHLKIIIHYDAIAIKSLQIYKRWKKDSYIDCKCRVSDAAECSSVTLRNVTWTLNVPLFPRGCIANVFTFYTDASLFIGYTQFHTLDVYNKRAFRRTRMQGLSIESGNKNSRRFFFLVRIPHFVYVILWRFYHRRRRWRYIWLAWYQKERNARNIFISMHQVDIHLFISPRYQRSDEKSVLILLK